MKVTYKNYTVITIEEFGNTKFDLYQGESAGEQILLAAGEFPGIVTKEYVERELKKTIEVIEEVEKQQKE